MKLNEENGVKIQITRHDLNRLNELCWGYKTTSIEAYKPMFLEKINEFLPKDGSIKVISKPEIDKAHQILCFLIVNTNTKIYPENWIIEEDEP